MEGFAKGRSPRQLPLVTLQINLDNLLEGVMRLLKRMESSYLSRYR